MTKFYSHSHKCIECNQMNSFIAFKFQASTDNNFMPTGDRLRDTQTVKQSKCYTMINDIIYSFIRFDQRLVSYCGLVVVDSHTITLTFKPHLRRLLVYNEHNIKLCDWNVETQSLLTL